MNKEKSTASIIMAAHKKKKEKSYWLKQLSGLPPRSSFPFDNEGSGSFSYAPGNFNFSLPEGIARQLINFSKGSDARLFIFLIAGVVILLRKYSGNKDILLGIPLSSSPGETELLNSALTIRCFCEDSFSFPQLLSHIQQTLIEAENHQNFPIEVLCDLLGLIWTRGEPFPLYNVAVLLKNIHYDDLRELSPGIMISFERKSKGIEGTLSYNSRRYNSITVERIVNHLHTLLGTLLAHPHNKISHIELLSVEERKQLLVVFNDTSAEFPESTAVHQLVDQKAESIPQANAVVYGDQQLSYAELADKTDRVAAALIPKGVKPNVIIGVLFDQSPGMVVTLLGILKTGAAYLPIAPDCPEGRLEYTISDSNAQWLVVEDIYLEKVREYREKVLPFMQLEQYSDPYSPPNPINKHYKKSPSSPHHHPNYPAYIIYTSGSTGKPKGVMIEHRSFIDFTMWAVDVFEHRTGYQVLLSNSYASDGAVQQIFPPLVSGGTLHLVDKELRLDTSRYLDYLKTNRINNIDEVPVLMNELLEQIPIDNKEEILPDLTCLSLGSEYVPIELVRKCRKHLNRNGRIINAYGPAEASVETTTYHFNGYSDSELSLIGKPRRNIRVYILDESGHCCPIGVRGEICISGVGLARGYLNQPELTAQRFIQNLHSDIPGDRLYKTGDQGSWLIDGNIRFLGRIDDQIKIRGNRVELSEIQQVLKGCEGIKDAVVLVRENIRGENEICAYYVEKASFDKSGFQKPIDKNQVSRYLSDRLPSYMIPTHLLSLEKIPITPNGKVDKNMLPNPKATLTEEYAPPENDLEKKLVKIWAEVLEREQDTLGIHSDFFKLGGHSLKAAILMSRIQKQLEVEMPLIQVFKTPTIAGQAEYLKASGKIKYISIEPVEVKEYYLLTPVQKRIYFLQQIDVSSSVYNVPGTITPDKSLSKKRLEEVFKKIIHRHEILRTSYEIIDGEPKQRVHKNVPFEIENFEISTEGSNINVSDNRRTDRIEKDIIDKIIKKFVAHFDLKVPPLLRVGLISKGNVQVLVVDMHHIICDPVSHEVLFAEFRTLCNDQELPGLRLQYRDYAQWQNSSRQKTKVKQQESYWIKSFEEDLPILFLPTDFSRPQVQEFEGASINFILDMEDLQLLKKVAVVNSVTFFMLILAIFNILLSKLSGQEDIIVGTPISSRNHEDIEKMIGMFVNTLAMRNYPVGHKTFSQFLQELKNKTLEAYENGNYPFEELIDKLSLDRDISRNPLFDVMFNHLKESELSGEVSEIKQYVLNQHINRRSKFDMSLTTVELNDDVIFNIEYRTKLFNGETIDRIIGYFKKLIKTIAEDPVRKLSVIQIISEEEKERLLFAFNDTAREYPKNKSIHHLFEEQVEKTPDGIATAQAAKNGAQGAAESMVTYNELNEKAVQLALQLEEKGVQPNSIVGIMMPRSIEMITGMLGILKSSCAYLPINQNYPEERKQYMLKDSGAKILLTRQEIADLPSRKASDFNLKGAPSHMHLSPVPSSSLAYIIFTSGSTGRPKGVMVNHLNVIRLVKNTNFINFKADDRILQTGALEFDASTFEIWGALLNGLSIYTTSMDNILNHKKMKKMITDNQITIIWLSSPLFNQLTQSDVLIFTGIRKLLVGGDVLSPGHINETRRLYPELSIINGYGPTENTTFSTTFSIDKEYKERIPIGKPIANSTAFIVDKNGNLQPIAIAGELLVGGAGVARGYLNLPELTAEKFYTHCPGTSFQISSWTSKNLLCPHSRTHSLTYSTIFRTNDLARWLPDGNIEFLGRIDYQVKIRGYRIELGEIENRLLNHEKIKESVVLAKEEKKGEKSLCAYIVFNSELAMSELREYLSKGLPDYMIPSYFIPIGAIPLTPNGKIDRKALNSYCANLDTGSEYVEPENAMEELLADIWKQVLNLDKIGMYDDFFKIGGNSLKVIQLSSQICKVLGKEIPIVKIFEHRTIRSFVRYLVRDGKDSENFWNKKIDRSVIINKAKESRGNRRDIRKRRNING